MHDHNHDHEHTDMPPQVMALIESLQDNAGRTAVWAKNIKSAMEEPGSTPESVAEVGMNLAEFDIATIFKQLMLMGFITWNESGLMPNENEVVVRIPLGGLAGDELRARCLEVVDGNQTLADQMYEAVVAHRTEHDLNDDAIGDEDHGEEIDVIVPVGSPLALKYGEQK